MIPLRFDLQLEKERFTENCGITALLKRLTVLGACEKQMQMDANMTVSTVFRRWITSLSHQWFTMSLEYLSELFIALVTWTVGISCCGNSVRLIHFKGELGFTTQVILIDTSFGKTEKSTHKDYYGWRFFGCCPYCRHFRNKNIMEDHKEPLFDCSPRRLSFSCQSQLGSGLGSNQSSWLGVSGSSCYKQPGVVSVANTILANRACLDSMTIREKPLFISPLKFQRNSHCTD